MMALVRHFQAYIFCLCDGLLRDTLDLKGSSYGMTKRIGASSQFVWHQLGQAHIVLRVGVLGLSSIFIILFCVIHGSAFTSAPLRTRIAYINSWRFSKLSLCRNLVIFYLNFALLGYFFED